MGTGNTCLENERKLQVVEEEDKLRFGIEELGKLLNDLEKRLEPFLKQETMISSTLKSDKEPKSICLFAQSIRDQSSLIEKYIIKIKNLFNNLQI